jgi:hypothetical protein
MSKWKSHSVLGLAVLSAVACSKNDSESDGAALSSDQTEISGNRSAAPSSAGEAIEEYLGSLEELVEIARNTTDEATAKENAPIFEQKARELNELGEALSDIGPGARHGHVECDARLSRPVDRDGSDHEESQLTGREARVREGDL